MFSLKKSATLITLTALITPIYANAADFVVRNDTKKSISFIINGACSKKFGDIRAGVIRAIPYPAFRDACGASPTNCYAQIINGDGCRGELAAIAVLDINVGVKNGQAMRTYTLTWSNMRMAIRKTVKI